MPSSTRSHSRAPIAPALLIAALAAGSFPLSCSEPVSARPAADYCHDWRGHGLCDRPARRERMREHWTRSDMALPPILPEELPEPESRGARIMVRYCMQCHNLAAPAMHSRKDWPGIVERMRLRLDWMSARTSPLRLQVPSDREYRLLNEYLRNNARDDSPPESLPEANSADGRAYRALCSRCHSLPDPARYTAERWPIIVERMEKYMRRAGQPRPKSAARARVLNYLKRNAGRGAQPTGP